VDDAQQRDAKEKDSEGPSPGFWSLASSNGTPRRSLFTALVVGTILTAVNQGDLVLAGEAPSFTKVFLNYFVPYCVATYGAVSTKRAEQKR
jgi:hypothetical protein